ncbi:Uncharacterised protein [Vibrio cholerae]|uniref:Uncharacterized protein n=1 Tax=Vibrio cholerae TaxID=666 RepID=A0A655Z4M1_VIBCL|nr:Uncharacterised protein [Vibrio cholerae]CSC60536.1 Uncharacterised protein [Vibrio cholerae]CSC84650.1 Uncharacterised protein [Vibrio cholerae]CSD14873.1 Uncharacterised protein [Vibrio cholerae]CSD15894.1 Uncharacterised protein [Vibrio cholerae]
MTRNHLVEQLIDHFHLHGHVRVNQFYLGTGDGLIEATPNITFEFNRGKIMLTTAFRAHDKGFVFEVSAI